MSDLITKLEAAAQIIDPEAWSWRPLPRTPDEGPASKAAFDAQDRSDWKAINARKATARTKADAILALLQAQAREAWRPIETAPKDGTFLAAIHHGAAGYVVTEAKRIGPGVHSTRDDSAVGWRPGHQHPAFWQPKPQPPSPEGAL